MTALEAVAVYLPEQRVPIEEVAAQIGLRPKRARVFRRYHGLAQVCRDPDRSLLDLLLAATARLTALCGRQRQVRYVLHARIIPVVAPYPLNPLHELCRRAGLGHATAFSVTHQACATGLLAIDIAGRLLAADGGPGALALVLTGEKAFTRTAQMLPDTAFFAEGAAACLVRHTGRRDRLLAYATLARGEFPASLAGVIHAAVARAGLRLGDISLILPHNVNLVAWRAVCDAIDFPIDRVLLDNVPVVGHSFCADPFINYQTAAERGLLHPGDRYLVAAVGAGLGATFSAMVFEH